ncbi:pilus assembly protein N-terminal domain-containing protein [Verminephrobacter aporrectodeae]|uniref:pilus assembly protein N-terminal domain-containing protein n=1 Tax=Verminephrobacter aporrectodeae TaxID=1110389 RepID=UPI002236FAB5|nr:pilus assembly protein N-terminal domain-containing protein [Verminephrobacter aporrectodeae]
MKNTLKFLFVLVAIVAAACGGGNSGTPNGPSATLRMQPQISGVIVPVGGGWWEATQIRGGTKPYDTFDNVGGLEAKVEDDVLWVRAYGTGEEGEIVVYDESSPSQQVKIKGATQAVPMSSNAGESFSLTAGQSRQFNVRGGIPGYTVISSNPAVAVASISRSAVVTVTAQSIAGDSDIVVTDATGVTTLKVKVTVQVSASSTSPALKADPESITAPANTVHEVIISGGTAPYTVKSAVTFDNTRDSNTNLATASISGSVVTVTLVAAGLARVVVTDSVGQSITISVTINPDLIKVAPIKYDVNENFRGDILFLIDGGTKPYAPLFSLDDQPFIRITMNNANPNPNMIVTVERCVDADRVIPIDIYDTKLIRQTVTLTIKNGTAQCVDRIRPPPPP